MYNLKWNIWLQYDLFLSVVKPFLKQTRTVFKKTAIGLLHFHPTALALGVHSESLLIIRKQNLQRNRISVKLPLKWLLCWPRGSELISSLMILKCYSSLKSYKARTTPFVSVGALFHCVFSELYWHGQRNLSWFQQGPCFGCGFWGSSTTFGTWLAELLIWWWAQKGRKQLDFSVLHSVCRPNIVNTVLEHM